jgi:DNA-binding GntR family transcriptional regulator
VNTEAALTQRQDTAARIDTATLFNTLRDRICLLDYPPGAVLREADMASEFGVSRTPIRSALQRLAHDGLIESRDGVGTIVTTPDFEEIRDIYQMRLKIAELIGQMNPLPIQPEHAATTDALVARARKIVDRFDVQEYWRINHDEHVLIAGIIGNAALREMWDRLYFQAARMWYSHARRNSRGIAEDLLAELIETRNAISQGDAVAIGYIQRNHIAYGLKRLELDNSP